MPSVVVINHAGMATRNRIVVQVVLINRHEHMPSVVVINHPRLATRNIIVAQAVLINRCDDEMHDISQPFPIKSLSVATNEA